jgi:hypothetical protein
MSAWLTSASMRAPGSGIACMDAAGLTISGRWMQCS